MTQPDALRAFGDSAEALEARIADAESRGVPVPPEAHAMLVSLRELARAIDDLQASLGTESPEPSPPPPTAADAAADAAAPDTPDAP